MGFWESLDGLFDAPRGESSRVQTDPNSGAYGTIEGTKSPDGSTVELGSDGKYSVNVMPDGSRIDNNTGQVITQGTGAYAGANAAAGSPYSVPGLGAGQSQTQFQGGDFTQYGPAEQQWQQTQGFYNTPGKGETSAYGTQDKYAASGTPGLTNSSQSWLDQYKGAMPNISSEPGLDGYYDVAKQRAAESIDQAAAARGNYGSSSAIDQNARAFSDLEAQKAKDEANYNLARLGEQRAWQSAGGQMAGQADANARGNSQMEQQWAQFLSGLGLDADRLGLQRQNAGMDAASVAGGAERNRFQDYFNNQLALGDRLSGVTERGLYPALDNDMALVEKVLSGDVSVDQATVNMDANAKAQFMTDLSNAASIAGTAKNNF